MSNILVTCHCKNNEFESFANPFGVLHPSLFYKERDTKIEPISEDVDYLDIDPGCPAGDHQYKSWSDVPENSKDYIYTLNCPLYYVIRNYRLYKEKIRGENLAMITNLVNDGWRILRPGGMIIIPIDSEVPKFRDKSITGPEAIKHQLDNLQEAARDFSTNAWVVESKTINDIPFTIFIKDRSDTYFLVLKKPTVGGRKRARKTRKTRRSKKRA